MMERKHRVFVGRERELGELRAGLEEAESGHGSLFLVVGEAGIGKTRLVEEIADEAMGNAAVVLWGRCREGEGAPPYWPWMQAMRSYLRASGAECALAEMGRGAPYLAHLVPEVRDRFPQLPAPPTSIESEHARFYLFDAVTTFLRAAAASRPLLLVFDDLQWADAPSLLLLRFFAHEIRDTRILLLGTYRDVEARRAPAVAEVIAALVRDGHHLPLRGLGEAAVSLLIERIAGSPPSPVLVRAIYEKTEGNPFFVDEIVRVLAAEGALEQPERVLPRGLPVPQGVRGAIRRRLAPLPATCQGILSVASVIGREFDVACLHRACNLAPDALLEVLADAIESGIIMPHPGTAGRYRFSHALIRETLYEELAPAGSARLHRRIGEVMEELHHADPRPHLAELAHHFLAAAPAGDPAKGVEYAARAGEWAVTSFAYEEAIALFGKALRVLDVEGQGDEARGCALLLSLGEAQWRAGDGPAARESFRAAAQVARRVGDAVMLARAALGFAGEGSRLLWVQTGVVDEALVHLLEEALGTLGGRDDALRSRLLSRVAINLYFSPSRERALAASDEAVVLARRTGDPRVLAAALQARYVALWVPEGADERLVIATEIVDVAARAGDRELALPGHRFRVIGFLERGDLAAADREIAAWAQIANELRQPLYLTHLAMWRAMRAILDGRFAEGEAEAERALELSRKTRELDGSQQLVTLIGIVRVYEGRIGELVEAVRRFAERNPAIPTWRCYLAYLHAETGDLDAARRELDALAADGFAAIPRDAHWLLASSFLAGTCAALGDHARAEMLYESLMPFARRIGVVAALSCWGAVAHYLGLLAATLGHATQAARHFEEALAIHESMGARPLAAWTRFAFGRAILDGRADGGADAAQALLSAALSSARELGMARLVERIAGTALPAGGTETDREVVLSRDGEFWTLTWGGEVLHLKDTKGLRCIACLLRHPGREFHGIELAAAVEGEAVDPGSDGFSVARALRKDGGEILDLRARQAYRVRLLELRRELDEAETFHDVGRVERLSEEREALERELSRALVLGRRARRERVPAERARVNLTKTILAALRRIERSGPVLGRHLRRAIRTGTFFSYSPEPGASPSWKVS